MVWAPGHLSLLWPGYSCPNISAPAAPLLRSAGKAGVNAPARWRRAQPCVGRLSELPGARVLWFRVQSGRLDSTQFGFRGASGTPASQPSLLGVLAVGEVLLKGLEPV